jgi:hypothetical protein
MGALCQAHLVTYLSILIKVNSTGRKYQNKYTNRQLRKIQYSIPASISSKAVIPYTKHGKTPAYGPMDYGGVHSNTITKREECIVLLY